MISPWTWKTSQAREIIITTLLEPRDDSGHKYPVSLINTIPSMACRNTFYGIILIWSPNAITIFPRNAESYKAQSMALKITFRGGYYATKMAAIEL
jgi:hypothetical protein